MRTDHALADGLVTSLYYDSMFAKIVTHGTNRADTYRCLTHALGDCLLLGLPTNRALLRDYAVHPAFLSDDVSTAFIDRHFPTAMRQAAVPDAAVCRTAAVLLTYLRQNAARRYPAKPYDQANSRTYPALCRFTLDGEAVDMRVHTLGARQWELTWDGGATQVAVVSVGDGHATLALNDAFHTMDYIVTTSTCHFVLNGIKHATTNTTCAEAGHSDTQIGSDRIGVSMNDRVVAVHVAGGEVACASQVLLVVEVMKMEHSIAMPLVSEVRGLFTQIGAQVAPGGLLMKITTA